MIAHRRQRAVEDLLDALDRILVPGVSQDGVFGRNGAQRDRGDAAKSESRALHGPALITIDRHRGRDGTDVVEDAPGYFVEAHQRRQWLGYLDRTQHLAG